VTVGAEPVAGRRTTATLVLVLVAGLAAAAVLLAGAHLLDQHRHYGSWSWSAASPTPLLPFGDREYTLGPAQSTVPDGLVRVGTTWDGLPIVGARPGNDVPTELFVRVSATSYVPYVLIGGP
jgi:hypothetical protein